MPWRERPKAALVTGRSDGSPLAKKIVHLFLQMRLIGAHER